MVLPTTMSQYHASRRCEMTATCACVLQYPTHAGPPRLKSLCRWRSVHEMDDNTLRAGPWRSHVSNQCMLLMCARNPLPMVVLLLHRRRRKHRRSRRRNQRRKRALVSRRSAANRTNCDDAPLHRHQAIACIYCDNLAHARGHQAAPLSMNSFECCKVRMQWCAMAHGKLY